jgi:hypothetical protein
MKPKARRIHLTLEMSGFIIFPVLNFSCLQSTAIRDCNTVLFAVRASKKVQIVDHFYQCNQITFQETEALRIVIQGRSVRGTFVGGFLPWLREAGGAFKMLSGRG